MTDVIRLLSIVIFAAVWWYSLRQCRAQHFYQETPLGWVFGIFVWGDAVVLLPWWMGVTIASHWLSLIHVARIIFLFWTVRAGYEVLYWLNHQAVKSSEVPPLLRSIKWLGSNEVAILYQVGQMCIALTSLILFLWTLEF